MVVYSTVTKEMFEKVGEEAIKNSFNCLRNFVATEDSVSELNVSLSNIKGEVNNFSGNPTMTVTDMIGEIEEVDMGDDAYTEMEDEEVKETFSIMEEVNVENSFSPQQMTSPGKEMTFDEKFNAELLKTPSEGHVHIK